MMENTMYGTNNLLAPPTQLTLIGTWLEEHPTLEEEPRHKEE